MCTMLVCYFYVSKFFIFKFLKDQHKSLKLNVLLNGIYWTAQQVQASIIQKNKTKLRKNRKLKAWPIPSPCPILKQYTFSYRGCKNISSYVISSVQLARIFNTKQKHLAVERQKSQLTLSIPSFFSPKKIEDLVRQFYPFTPSVCTSDCLIPDK